MARALVSRTSLTGDLLLPQWALPRFMGERKKKLTSKEKRGRFKDKNQSFETTFSRKKDRQILF